jgi:RHS repeat-associated protein
LQTRYLRGDVVDQIFARLAANGTAAWYLTDRQGSVRDVTDASGAVQDHLSYGGFGNVLSESNAAFGDRYKYTGRELDSETGLQYNRARYYDPKIGRWTSEDPSGFQAADPDLYRYVHNGPTNASDPSGLEEDVVGSGIDDDLLPTVGGSGFDFGADLLPTVADLGFDFGADLLPTVEYEAYDPSQKRPEDLNWIPQSWSLAKIGMASDFVPSC